jgi:hypothetical protein
MKLRSLPLSDLRVNQANDRHGELENETAAIAWLFHNREQHMRNLTKDIVASGELYEPPLVSPDGAVFIVFDGNRRVTCLKLLADSRRAPTTELQEFFRAQRAKWKGAFPVKVQCEVEADRERIDEILFRRHTGSQSGVGQSNWDDRMKSNFVIRTGKTSGLSVADEIEKRLVTAALLPSRRKIPRSTLNRLLSSEPLRNRVGISVTKGRFQFTHQPEKVLFALARIATDLANRNLVLGHIWDTEGKRKYLDKLETEGVLPSSAHRLPKPTGKSAPLLTPGGLKSGPKPTPDRRTTLIPQVNYPITWTGKLQRHRAIWEELQFHLELSRHSNAVSVLFRVLFELSVENYIRRTALTTVKEADNLAKRALRVAEDMHSKAKIDKKYLGVFQKLSQIDPLFSLDTLNRYVHSPNFAPSPEHLAAMWDTVADYVVECLDA